uniref:Carbon monoxide dehydrogenase 2 n=1 Tax=Anthurium amnicola TaxID=1678845 RepID=A0A1D1ZBY7_9ARAE
MWTSIKQLLYHPGCKGDKIEMCHLHGHHERRDINFLWSHLLQTLHHKCCPHAEEVPDLPGKALYPEHPSHLSSRDNILTSHLTIGLYSSLNSTPPPALCSMFRPCGNGNTCKALNKAV